MATLVFICIEEVALPRNPPYDLETSFLELFFDCIMSLTTFVRTIEVYKIIILEVLPLFLWDVFLLCS